MPKVFNGLSWKFVCKMGVWTRIIQWWPTDPINSPPPPNVWILDKLTVRKWTDKFLVVTHWPTYAINLTFQPKQSTSWCQLWHLWLMLGMNFAFIAHNHTCFNVLFSCKASVRTSNFDNLTQSALISSMPFILFYDSGIMRCSGC